MAFEIFKETGTRTKEFISITETKTFGLSRAFLDKHQITKDHKVVILYDADSNEVALCFTRSDAPYAFAVRIANEKHGATIVAKSFFELKNIDAKKYAGRYSDFKRVTLRSLGIDKQGEAYLIELKENLRSGQQTSQDEDDPDDRPIDLSEIPF